MISWTEKRLTDVLKHEYSSCLFVTKDGFKDTFIRLLPLTVSVWAETVGVH